MFRADRGEAPLELARRLSEAEDGFSTGAAFDQAFCDKPSFQLTTQNALGEGPLIAALGDYPLDYYDAIVDADTFDDAVLDPLDAEVKKVAGVAWPTPYKAPDFVTATTGFVPSKDLGTLGIHEWDIQAKLTRNLTSLSGMSLGAAGTDDDLDFDSPMTASLAGLGALAETRPADPRVKAYRKVVTASAMAGTELAGKAARDLLKKSQKIAKLADDRTKAAAEARAGAKRALREVDMLDRRAKLLAKQLLDDEGRPRPDITLADLERLKKLRTRAVAIGRDAVRYQKVNALATPLAQNGIAQAGLLQMMASTVLTGDTGATAALGATFHEIGKKSAEIRNVRKKQLAKWEQKDALEGFAATVSFGDPYESELNAIELSDLEFFAAVELGFLKKARRKLRRRVRKIGKGIARKTKSIAKTAVRVAKDVGKTTGKLIKTTTIDPVRVTVKAARRAAKGDIRGAFREVGRGVRKHFKDIGNVAGKLFLDYPCQLAKTKLVSAAVQAAGQAVGTVVGGTAGGAVGSEAGRQAVQINKTLCAGMKQVGLTKGTFRPGQVRSAFVRTAKGIYNTSFSPKALLGAATRIAQGTLTGGGIPGIPPVSLDAGKLLNQVGGKALNQLGVDRLIPRAQILQQAIRPLTRGVTGTAKGLVTQQARSIGKAVARQAGIPVSRAALLRRAGLPTSVGQAVRRAGLPTSRAALVRQAVAQGPRFIQQAPQVQSVRPIVGRIGDFF